MGVKLFNDTGERVRAEPSENHAWLMGDRYHPWGSRWGKIHQLGENTP